MAKYNEKNTVDELKKGTLRIIPQGPRKCRICSQTTAYKNSANGHYVCSSECLELDTLFDKE